MLKPLGSVVAAILMLMVAGCTSLPAAEPASPAAAAERPNILFVLVDDMGFADLSVTGNTRVSTPNIDRLAAEGLLMTEFYVGSPICSPSRAAFMTGNFPARHGFVSYIDDRQHNVRMAQADWLDPSVPMLPRALGQVGYATGHFGKWHMGGGRDIGNAPLPTAYGFNESYTQFEGLGPRALMTEDHFGHATRSAALGQGPIDWLPKAALTARYIDKTLDFVARNRDRPWFAQLWLDDVHDPFEPTAEQLAAVRGTGRNEAEEKFFAVLVAMDEQIGRLVSELERQGELDDTIIILTGDNGPVASRNYYENGAVPPGDTGGRRGRKASLYEGGIREPLIVRWPARIRPGTRDTTTIAGAVDLFPTLARIAGATGPGAPDGISLLGAWSGTPIADRPPLFWAYGGYGEPGRSPRPTLERDRSPPFAIRSGPWKLLARGDGSNAELYNIAEDPAETRNLIAERRDIANALTPRLVAWRETLPRRNWRREGNGTNDPS